MRDINDVASLCLASFISDRPIPVHMKIKITFCSAPKDAHSDTHH